MQYELEFEDRSTALARPRRGGCRATCRTGAPASGRRRGTSSSDGCLRLLIEADQEPWCPELDGERPRLVAADRGFAGPGAAADGQHRFNPAAVVREAQENVRLYTPERGRSRFARRATDDPDAMVALWMIGYEDRPERSAEICVCEIFGRDVADGAADVGMGVHPFGDPAIVDDFEQVRVPIDVRELHEYAAEWTAERRDVLRRRRARQDGRAVAELPDAAHARHLRVPRARPPGRVPEAFTVDYVRGHRLVG